VLSRSKADANMRVYFRQCDIRAPLSFVRYPEMASFQDVNTKALLQAVAHLSSLLQNNEPAEVFWSSFSDALNTVFTHTSCTILSYEPSTRILTRLFSSRPDVHKIGGRKRVTDSFWTRTVLENGQTLIGSDREDLKKFFSEHEALWAHGWESVLNIPIRANNRTVGSINLHNSAGAYDNIDFAITAIFAQLAVAPIVRWFDASGVAAAAGTDTSKLEFV
jgi:transcriptional regulator with GAF, ATPase, and Fis domain